MLLFFQKMPEMTANHKLRKMIGFRMKKLQHVEKIAQIAAG